MSGSMVRPHPSSTGERGVRKAEDLGGVGGFCRSQNLNITREDIILRKQSPRGHRREFGIYNYAQKFILVGEQNTSFS